MPYICIYVRPRNVGQVALKVIKFVAEFLSQHAANQETERKESCHISVGFAA